MSILGFCDLAHDSSGPVESLEKDHVRPLDLGCVCERENINNFFLKSMQPAACLFQLLTNKKEEFFLKR